MAYELAQFSKKYIGVDKFDTHISDELKKNNDIVFYKNGNPSIT